MDAKEFISLIGADSNDYTRYIDSVENTAKTIIDSAKDSKPVLDSYGNTLLAVGNDDKVIPFTNFSFTNETLNWPLWMALYNDSWVFKRAIDKPSQDMVRCGITLGSKNDENNKKVYKDFNTHRSDFIQLLQWGHLFGGSVAVMMFDNYKDEDYAKPISWDKVRKSKSRKFYVVDRWYGVQPSDKTVDNMASLDYGKPRSYKITFPNGHSFQVHHDYILRFEGRVAPKLIKNGMLQGWGYSEGSHILSELTRDEKLKSSVQSLVDKALIEVIKMAGMRGLFMGTDKGNEEQIRKRLEMVNWGRNFNSLTFLDKEDEYTEHGFSGLGGLSDLLQQNMWQIAAALEMQGVLFGDLKQGFSNDSEALERYDETINGRCETYLRPVYEKYIAFLFKLYEIDDTQEFQFNSLLVNKQTKNKMEAFNQFIQLCSQLMNDGVITLEQYGRAVQTFSTKNIIDFGLDDDVIAKLKEKEEEESEAFNFGGEGGDLV